MVVREGDQGREGVVIMEDKTQPIDPSNMTPEQLDAVTADEVVADIEWIHGKMTLDQAAVIRANHNEPIRWTIPRSLPCILGHKWKGQGLHPTEVKCALEICSRKGCDEFRERHPVFPDRGVV